MLGLAHLLAKRGFGSGTPSGVDAGLTVFDMVGNLNEWVTDWAPRSTLCGDWSVGVSPTGDFQCLAGAATAGEPGALLRGGNFFNGSRAGPLAVDGASEPSGAGTFGFRCAR